MKKFILSAIMALSCGALFAAEPTDMYLYWMIDEGASFKDKSGEAVPDFSISDYTVQISAGNGNYLYLYSSPGATSSGKSVGAENAFGWEMVAGIGGYGAGSSFIFELVNDSGVAFQSESMSYDSLAQYMSPMSGMATPAQTYAVTAFTAVPEPTSGLLLLLGVAGLALRRKKMQKA